jgi:GTP-binding protein Era
MREDFSDFKSAIIALIGRPNCGKSTLLNTIIGENISIVSPLPQTTQKNTRGLYNGDNYQLVFIDTPGIHKGRHTLNRSMFKQSMNIFKDKGIDLLCYIVDLSRSLGVEEDRIVSMVKQLSNPVLLIFNKTDICTTVDKSVKQFFERYQDLEIKNFLTLCAHSFLAKELFLKTVEPLLTYGPRYYPDDIFSDSNLRFFASEFIRKQIIESTTHEVPHASCVEIVSYKEMDTSHSIEAVIHVETQGQKGIIIGKKGRMITKIKKQAQKELEHLTGVPVTIACHVSVTPKWRDNKRFLDQLGFF